MYTCTTLLPNFYPADFQLQMYMHVFSSTLANIVDPDQKPADLDLQCFQKKKINPGSAEQVLVKKASSPLIFQ